LLYIGISVKFYQGICVNNQSKKSEYSQIVEYTDKQSKYNNNQKENNIMCLKD